MFYLFSVANSQELHECTRVCHNSTESFKTCRYKWVLENYLTLSRACADCPFNITDCLRHECVTGDGVMRPIRTVNRRMPGPDIQVSKTKAKVISPSKGYATFNIYPMNFYSTLYPMRWEYQIQSACLSVCLSVCVSSDSCPIIDLRCW